MIPWFLLAVTALLFVTHLWSDYCDAYGLFIKNHILDSSIYCFSQSAASGHTNEVMEVLREVWSESKEGHGDIYDACLAKRTKIMHLPGPAQLKE